MNYLIIIQFVIYLLFAFWGPADQISDGESYRIILSELFFSDGIYPNSNHIFNNYINNPGAVNVYLFIMKLFKSNNMRILFISNALLLSSGNFFIIKTIKNNTYKILFFIVTTFYLSNISLVNTISSDILSYFLICFCIFIFSEKIKVIFNNNILVGLLGILIGFFDYVRPVGGLFLYSIIFAMFIVKKEFRLNYVATGVRIFILVASFFFFKMSLSQLHYYETGNKINGSISTGYNLLMGTGAKSDGSWTSGVFNKGGKGYFNEIKSTHVEVKNERWIKQSIDTIISNPSNFLIKGFRKLSLTFGYDLLGIQNLTSPRVRDLSLGKIIKNPNIGLFNWLIVFINNIIYFFIFAWFVLKLFCFIYLKQMNVFDFVNVTLLIFLLLYISVIYVVIGGARYHHILIPLMLFMNFRNYNFNLKNE